MKSGNLWIPASLEDDMKKLAVLGALVGIAFFSATSANAQGTNYPGMCTGYTSASACYGCCRTLAKGNSDCTNSCAAAFPGPNNARAQMSPKPKSR